MYLTSVFRVDKRYRHPTKKGAILKRLKTQNVHINASSFIFPAFSKDAIDATDAIFRLGENKLVWVRVSASEQAREALGTRSICSLRAFFIASHGTLLLISRPFGSFYSVKKKKKTIFLISSECTSELESSHCAATSS
ncbi:hypothetical protein POVCU2_0022970 [Plasmodium ovale curtisi]|uniref:Uncharacterized protein n=1 Tax=Plasmodium ovale curtisi TaxID=864141 RepID=A0A1A8VWT9_PLAOA|nr:hypothetical protein POVCU2_0022970 [Plasmodium ovale curtisi]